MKWKLVAVGIVIIAVAIYLNYAYGRIYKLMSEGYLAYFSGPAVFTFSPRGAAPAKQITYIAIGDSLTAGAGASSLGDAYPYLLAKRASEEKKLSIKLVNLGVPGSSSGDVIRDQLATTTANNPDFITILIGVNDIHQRMGVKNFRKNLRVILDAVSKTDAKIYVLTIPYLGDKKLMLPPHRAYFDWQTKQYNKVLLKEAAKTNATVIDLYSLTREAALSVNNYYSRDRFHPSADTYASWANLIYAHINF